MANYAVWNVRKRHEWLAKPKKRKYISRRKRERIGLQEALDRKDDSGESPSEETSSET